MYWTELYLSSIVILLQVEEEMELIEQDFLEAMFDDLLREEDEQQVYYGPPDSMPNQSAQAKTNCSAMQLPKV